MRKRNVIGKAAHMDSKTEILLNCIVQRCISQFEGIIPPPNRAAFNGYMSDKTQLVQEVKLNINHIQYIDIHFEIKI